MASNTTLLGAAGEHYVMAELLRRGYIAALAPHGVPIADIVVTDLEGARLCSIQVKSRRDIGSDRGWHMKAKHEQMKGDRLFYCFVDFGGSLEDRPTVHVVPAAVVADVLALSHRKYLATPGAKGQQRKDGDMRRFVPDYSKTFGADNPYPDGWLSEYRSAWHLLRLDHASAEPSTELEP
jgi:hypothetical protein